VPGCIGLWQQVPTDLAGLGTAVTIPCVLVAAGQLWGSGRSRQDWGARKGEQLLPEEAWRQARAARQSSVVISWRQLRACSGLQ